MRTASQGRRGVVRSSAAVSAVALAALGALGWLGGCVAARPTPDAYGTIGGVAPLPALHSHAQLPGESADAAAELPSSLAYSASGGAVMDRSGWSPVPLLAPSDLTLHPPHYAPLRLDQNGDGRLTGRLPTLLEATTYGSGNGRQLRGLALEPFVQLADLVMIPVRMVTQTPPTRLDASPTTGYERAPRWWADPLPMTGRPVGPVGDAVVSSPAEGRRL
ncbi:MAG: hypothetical protein KatS3mg103_0062 [Phycisphaerales bacterium]|nr:MAG: hypothetical protein KatS3mg103_0062 [Phycisphaerales bacterium]